MRQISEVQLSYRQFFARMRGAKDDVQSPILAEVLDAEYTEERPPEMPNVYTDGSVANPALKKFGLGGAGAWWPGRRNGVLNWYYLCVVTMFVCMCVCMHICVCVYVCACVCV